MTDEEFAEMAAVWDDRDWDLIQRYVEAMEESAAIREEVERRRGRDDYETRFYRTALHLHDRYRESVA